MKGSMICICFFVLIMQGCATYRNPADNIQVSTQVRIERDNFKKITTWNGPDLVQWHDATNANAGSSSVMLRAFKFDSGADVTYQIYVADNYSGDWRFYDSIYDSDGNKLETIKIASDVVSCRSGCTLSEHVAATVSRDYLKRHIDSGIALQISGRGNKFVVNIPSFYIQGFLKIRD